MQKILFIYNEGTDGPSNKYFEMIQKTATEMQINVVASNSLSELQGQITDLANRDPEFDNNFGVLIMQPFKAITMNDVNDFFEVIGIKHDIDNVTGRASYVPATAQGIYDYIVNKYPNRKDAVIGVIGRGVVGNVLLQQLIGYGYTIVEINSTTDIGTRDLLLSNCNVIVGLSTQNGLYTDDNIWKLGSHNPLFIDAGTNFKFEKPQNRVRCGAWTRQVLFSRI